MNKENTAPSFPVGDEKESCCSNTGCCGPQSPVNRLTPKVGRNDPCPFCDSGRKYKKCCGQ